MTARWSGCGTLWRGAPEQAEQAQPLLECRAGRLNVDALTEPDCRGHVAGQGKLSPYIERAN